MNDGTNQVGPGKVAAAAVPHEGPTIESDLTPEFFSKALRHRYNKNSNNETTKCDGPPPRVATLTIKREESGVLSHVYRVHLEYENQVSKTDVFKSGKGKAKEEDSDDDDDDDEVECIGVVPSSAERSGRRFTRGQKLHFKVNGGENKSKNQFACPICKTILFVQGFCNMIECHNRKGHPGRQQVRFCAHCKMTTAQNKDQKSHFTECKCRKVMVRGTKRHREDEQATAKAATRTALLPPTEWIVKLCRPDLNLSWMCRNETLFYSIYAPELFSTSPSSPSASSASSLSSTLPFTIPGFLSGSDHHLVLEQILEVETHVLAEGCPADKLEFLVKSLAALHGTCWKSDVLETRNPSGTPAVDHDKALVFPVGMGQRLPPLQKEGLFVQSWQDTLENMDFGEDNMSGGDSALRNFASDLCQRLARLRLRDVHDRVHRHRITLVHGDYHIANWLWPRNDTKPILVDWATAGYGNPMVDFVFFLVVSTDDEVVSNSPAWLENYHDLLVESNPSLASTVAFSTLKEWFQWALLCQWLILVSYDEMCRGLAQSEPDGAKREMTSRHFNNVNRRTVLAMKSIEDWENVLSQIPEVTSSEKQEAQDFCRCTPLAI